MAVIGGHADTPIDPHTVVCYQFVATFGMDVCIVISGHRATIQKWQLQNFYYTAKCTAADEYYAATTSAVQLKQRGRSVASGNNNKKNQLLRESYIPFVQKLQIVADSGRWCNRSPSLQICCEFCRCKNERHFGCCSCCCFFFFFCFGLGSSFFCCKLPLFFWLLFFSSAKEKLSLQIAHLLL